MRWCVSVGLSVAAALATTPALAQGVALKPGQGQKTVQTLCGRCHAIGVVIGKPHTADEWTDIIGRMLDKGLVANDAQLEEAADYLTKNYGPPPKAAAKK